METIERMEEYKNRYLYLDDNFLSRDFDFCVNIESTPKINIQIILFSIDYSCKYVEYEKTEKKETPLPFLKFAGISNNYVFQFPSFDYECIQDDAEKNETQFRNTLIETLLSTFQISPPSSPDFFETIYRGLFVHGDSADSRTVYTVIDYDDLSKLTPESSHITWALVDELIFQEKVLGNFLDPRINDAFDSRPYLWNITYNGDYLEYFPFVLYLVISRENEYESDSIAVDENAATQTQTQNPVSLARKEKTITIGSKLDTYSLVDEYGDRYCFTSEPIVSKPGVVRYAVFTPKPKYIVDGSGVVNTEGVVEAEDVADLAEASIPFDLPLVGGDAVPEPDTEPTDDDQQKEVLEEKMSEKIAYPVIYFTEKTGTLAGKYMWGIKSSDLFVAV